LKVFVLQRIRLAAIAGELARPGMGAMLDAVEYRIGYYIVSPGERTVDVGSIQPADPGRGL
jgi:hypothetical protein